MAISKSRDRFFRPRFLQAALVCWVICVIHEHQIVCKEHVFFIASLTFDFNSLAILYVSVMFSIDTQLDAARCSFCVIGVVYSCVFVFLAVEHRDFKPVKVFICRCIFNCIGFACYWQLVKFLQGSLLDAYSQHFFGIKLLWRYSLKLLFSLNCSYWIKSASCHNIWTSCVPMFVTCWFDSKSLAMSNSSM